MFSHPDLRLEQHGEINYSIKSTEKLVCNRLLCILLYSQVPQEGHQSVEVSEGGAKD